MTHEGRMQRGKENYEKNRLLDNEDTKYYLASINRTSKTEEKRGKKK